LQRQHFKTGNLAYGILLHIRKLNQTSQKETEMFKKLMLALWLALLLTQFAVPTVLAADVPSGGCAPGFTLERAMEHDNHPHHHVGTSADQNWDGFICMKPVTPTGKIHVHVDNNLS